LPIISAAGTPVISSMARFQAITLPPASMTNVASGRKLITSARNRSDSLSLSSASLRTVMSMREATLFFVPGMSETVAETFRTRPSRSRTRIS